MKRTFYTLPTLFLMILMLANRGFAQSPAMDFNNVDCNGNPVHLFADLDAGNAVVLFFYMANCGSCPPKAQKIQTMTNHINTTYPGTVKGYAFPFTNATTCSYSQSWVNNNGLSTLFAPMDSGSAMVNYYGGFGMPTVVLVGGSNHEVLFVTQNFVNSDTTTMRNEILALLGVTAIQAPVAETFDVYPNPASDAFTVAFDLKEAGNLHMELFDVAGRQVATLMNENQNSGMVTRKFVTSGLANGSYWLRISVNGKSTTRKLSIQR